MSDYDGLSAGLNEAEAKLKSLLSLKVECLIRVKTFRNLLEQAMAAHENFEDSMKEYKSMVRELESINTSAKIFIERYNKRTPQKK